MVSEPGVNGVHGDTEGIHAGPGIGRLSRGHPSRSHHADTGSATRIMAMIRTTDHSLTIPVPGEGAGIHADGILARSAGTAGHKLDALMVPGAVHS